MIVVPVKFIGVHGAILMEHIPFSIDLFPSVLNGFSVFLGVVPLFIERHPTIGNECAIIAHQVAIYKSILLHSTCTVEVVPFAVELFPSIFEVFSRFSNVVAFSLNRHPLIRTHDPFVIKGIPIKGCIFKHFSFFIEVIPFLVNLLPLTSDRHLIDMVISDSISCYKARISGLFNFFRLRFFIRYFTFSTSTNLFSCRGGCCLFLSSRGDSSYFACRHF